jgi:hypothetical protein
MKDRTMGEIEMESKGEESREWPAVKKIDDGVRGL